MNQSIQFTNHLVSDSFKESILKINQLASNKLNDLSLAFFTKFYIKIFNILFQSYQRSCGSVRL